MQLHKKSGEWILSCFTASTLANHWPDSGLGKCGQNTCRQWDEDAVGRIINLSFSCFYSKNLPHLLQCKCLEPFSSCFTQILTFLSSQKLLQYCRKNTSSYCLKQKEIQQNRWNSNIPESLFFQNKIISVDTY